MAPQDRTVERVLAERAGNAQGVVTRRELLDAHISSDEIKHRIHVGLLIPEFRGVYRVGHSAPNRDAHYLAAVRACGEGAVLFGRAAGHLLSLLKGEAPRPEVITRTERRIEGIRTRRSRNLDPADVMVFNSIPATTVPRTLVDLASALRLYALARACHEAGVLYRTTPRQVEAVLRRRPNSPGAGQLHEVMGGKVRVTLSKLESTFLALLRAAGLPLPLTNVVAGSRRVDCRWVEHRLTVELDSFRFHNSRYSWEQDRKREREARMRGDEFRRYSWADVFEDPAYMLRELGSLLGCPA